MIIATVIITILTTIHRQKLVMSWVHAGQVVSLQSSLSCAS